MSDLQSKAYARILDLVSEGEIGGLVDGAKSIYLDGTRLQNDDNTYNFEDVIFDTRNGTQTQTYIAGTPAVESEANVGVEITKATPLVRTISDSNVNAVRITLSTPSLYRLKDDGDQKGTDVTIAIDVQTAGGGYVPQVIGQRWLNGTTTVTSQTYRSNSNVYGISIIVEESLSGTIEYRLVGAPTWSTAGLYQISDSSLQVRNSSDELVTINTVEVFTPTLINGQYEIRSTAVAASYISAGRVLRGTPYSTIDGKATSKYQRSYRVPLTGTGPWDIRVRRITDDTTDLKLQNKTYWDSYTAIVDAKLRYPNSALVSMRFDAAAFSGIPSRAYDLKLLKVKIPRNYNPTTRVYTGTWDGTFVTAWTDNPAWCFYDLVTNTRYGLGGYIDSSQVDKWALYSIAQYCDQLVSDGFGGIEPRFTCNLYLQSRAEAFKVVQDLASCFRSMAFWASGSLTLSQDAPSDPVGLFTQANVVEGLFTYSGSSAKARHTVALVTWNDPADRYEQKVEYVEDQEAIARFGVVPTEVAAIGCTSRGQAHRVGRWLLYSERYESEVVSFQTGIEGAIARPGQIIKVADASRAGVRLGGRVKTATTTAVTLDATVTLGASSWTLYVMLPNGTVASAAVTGATGQTINLATSLTTAPQTGAQWILTTSTVEDQTFRVLTITEQDGGKVDVTALRYDSRKYDAVENNLVLQPRDFTLLNDPPDVPTNGSLSEYLYSSLTDVKVGVTVTWPQIDRAASYELTYRIDSGNPVTATTTSNSLEILDAAVGTYQITIKAISSLGIKSAPYTLTASVLGKTAKPADVAGLQMTVQADTGILQWDSHADLDVRIGGQISFRYSEETSNALWNTSLPIGDFPGSSTSASVPLRAGTYLAKAKDSSGNYSQNATLVVTDAPNIVQFNAVASSQQDPGFTGAKTNLVVVNERLQLDQATYWDSIADLDAFTLNTDGGLVESGEYEFDTYVDTGAVYTSRVAAKFSVVTFNISNLVDQWPLIDSLGEIDAGALAADYVDSWLDWDVVINFDNEDTTNDASLQVYISTTNGNPASSPPWSDWRVFYVGDYTARAFRFKVSLSRGPGDDSQVALASLGVTVDVPDRVESKNNVLVPDAGVTVPFQNAFFATPAVAITAENMATGDYAQITAKTPAGFTIQFKNAAGAGVARTMDWIAKGFGYQN